MYTKMNKTEKLVARAMFAGRLYQNKLLCMFDEDTTISVKRCETRINYIFKNIMCFHARIIGDGLCVPRNKTQKRAKMISACMHPPSREMIENPHM